MGRVAQLIDFVVAVRRGVQYRQARGKTGGGEVRRATHFSSPGDDSHPLPTDFYLAVSVPGADNDAAAGYVDPNNAYSAQPGEKRIYGRDASGAQMNELHLKNTGEIVAQNDNASITIAADGTITAVSGSSTVSATPGGAVSISGDTIDLTAPGGVTINGASFATGGAATLTSASIGGSDYGSHFHNQGDDSNGDTQAPTGGPVNV